MNFLYGFVAGFASTLLFHQGALFGLQQLGATSRGAWDMTPVPPLGVPAVVSLAFFGGLWGIALWSLIRGQVGTKYWIAAVALGAILPSAVALLVVFPLKGLPFAAGWEPKIWIGALLVNAAWGLGVAILMLAVRRKSVPAPG